MIKKITKFVRKNWLILLIWLVGLFLRFYNQNNLLGFYYDQGRDAQMAQDILSATNFPAIGPTTGIQGLLLGPFWFYLITPGYFFAQGDPAIASLFICFLESLTIPLLFILIKKNWNSKAAYLAASIWAFSYYLIKSSRWFSNPSPLPFFVILMIFLLVAIYRDKKTKYWPLVAFILGLTIQLEAASAIFFIPTIGILVLFNFKKTFTETKISTWFKSIVAFCILLLPQVAFEIKNNFIITKSFLGFLTGKVNSDTGKTWALPTIKFLQRRIPEFYHIFFSKLDTNITAFSLFFLVVLLIGIFFLFKKHFRKNYLVQISLLWFIVPLCFLIFFVGNYGVLYDYYLTGFFAAFVILISLIICWSKNLFFKLLLIVFAIYFYLGNVPFLKIYLTSGIDGPENIVYGNEIRAVDFICQQTLAKPYNLDIYVPPVIPRAYDYLFDWRIRQNKCTKPALDNVDLIYNLIEVDPPHPERLDSWLQNQNHIGTIESVNQFGGVYVQQRQRSK